MAAFSPVIFFCPVVVNCSMKLNCKAFNNLTVCSTYLQAEEDLLLGREGKGALLESRTRVS